MLNDQLMQLNKDLAALMELEKLQFRSRRLLQLQWAFGDEKRIVKWAQNLETYKTLFTRAVTADARYPPLLR
jgi:hypothetical protein